MRTGLTLLAFVLTAGPAFAQTEDQLRAFFEGKHVVVKLDMPASDDGIDVEPGTTRPVDHKKYASRLKEFGTALRRGDTVLVTKVKVKKDLIEFQLGGGGYGTLGDDMGTDVHVAPAYRTEREKNLEKEIEKTTDSGQRKAMKEELDALRHAREREDARNKAAVADAEQAKAARIQERRLGGGSRFNLRYKPVVPAEALTPESVMQALSEYVDFSMLLGSEAEVTGMVAGDLDQLRKGLTIDQVDALLGRPESITERKEGDLTLSVSTYQTNDRRITADFVEGILIRFVITSP
jgi:hypothetical protein